MVKKMSMVKILLLAGVAVVGIYALYTYVLHPAGIASKPGVYGAGPFYSNMNQYGNYTPRPYPFGMRYSDIMVY